MEVVATTTSPRNPLRCRGKETDDQLRWPTISLRPLVGIITGVVNRARLRLQALQLELPATSGVGHPIFRASSSRRPVVASVVGLVETC